MYFKLYVNKFIHNIIKTDSVLSETRGFGINK